MDNDGLGQYLLQGGNHTVKSEDGGDLGRNLSQARDDEDLVVS